MNLSQSKGDEMFDVTVLKKSMLNFIDNTTEFGSVIYGSQDDNESMASNNTMDYEFELPREYIFDRKEVRIIFITLYSLVFCCCFFGELHFFCLQKVFSISTWKISCDTNVTPFIFDQLPKPIFHLSFDFWASSLTTSVSHLWSRCQHIIHKSLQFIRTWSFISSILIYDTQSLMLCSQSFQRKSFAKSFTAFTIFLCFC